MANIYELDPAKWDEWLSARPPVVQEIAKKWPPDRLYRMQPNGEYVTVLSYFEDGTVKVDISAEYNFVVFERQVFGVHPEHLTECDVPDRNAPRGCILPNEHDVRLYCDMLLSDKE